MAYNGNIYSSDQLVKICFYDIFVKLFVKTCLYHQDDILIYHFQESTNLKAVFIDTFYVKLNQKEASKFQTYTKELISFANAVEPFECKDIKTALTELMEAEKTIKNLNNQLQDAKNQLKENSE